MFSDRDEQRLRDIVENADAIDDYTGGLTFAQFKSARMVQDATERCIERAIEATVQIGPKTMAHVLASFPAAEVRGMGKRLRHEYGAINPELVWATAKGDVPRLREACVQILVTIEHAR